jgi:uncharacterized protein (DUF2141 family)
MINRKSLSMGVGTLTALLPFVTSWPQVAAQLTGGSVRVRVATFRNTDGALQCRLFQKPETFPDGNGVRTVRATIRGTVADCAWEGVPPGTYAIAVVHDENANRRLDKNLFGVPSEGYGVSNNHTYALSAPTWDESKFTVTTSDPVFMHVRLRY